MKPPILICMLLGLFEMSHGLIRQYFFIPAGSTWFKAQSYCRENYYDLATVTTTEEDKALVNTLKGLKHYGWIGMNKTDPFSKIWQWSDGEPVSYYNWYINQPNPNSQVENCVNAGPLGWNDQDCYRALPFYCYRHWTVVTGKKTWQEALDYCKTNKTTLLSPAIANQLIQVETADTQNQTAGIWTGLQFLDGRWFWINGNGLELPVDLPSCPVYGSRCGARNLNTLTWENHDCNEKLNFICN